MKHDTTHIRATKSLLAAAAALLLFGACQSDPSAGIGRRGSAIEFGASIHECDEVRTRGVEGLDSIYISADKYNVDFYIQLCTQESDGTEHREIGTYTIPSGYEGRLSPKSESDVLDWYSLNTTHTFYSWTVPWENPVTADGVTAWTPAEPLQPLRVEFHNSAEDDGYDDHLNNAVLEKFIGAKSADYSYDKHGKYVDLTYYHLVSKIRIGSLVLIENSGAVQEDLKADITFINMPTAATFYPHPQNGGRPSIDKATWERSPDSGVTYFVKHSTNIDVFYICPEIDFSEVDFKVKLNTEKYADYDTYYGTFDNVEFVRKPGTAHDSTDGDDRKILHAGEMMTINIQLIPGIGPGLSVVIDKWSTDEVNESQFHTYPGIYSDSELRDLLDTFINQKQYRPTPDNIDWLFEMYGKTENGNKYFQLLENVTTDSNIFPIPEGYILDGMGHTITMKSNGSLDSETNGVKNPRFNIGPARDVWLTDGTRTIYIDEDGWVWYYDEAGELQRGDQLTPLEGEQKSYDISSVDGKVHKSTYYNNNIVGS